jgi:hypothetical protein
MSRYSILTVPRNAIIWRTVVMGAIRADKIIRRYIPEDSAFTFICMYLDRSYFKKE